MLMFMYVLNVNGILYDACLEHVHMDHMYANDHG